MRQSGINDSINKLLIASKTKPVNMKMKRSDDRLQIEMDNIIHKKCTKVKGRSML